jgi:hypothetical protein
MKGLKLSSSKNNLKNMKSPKLKAIIVESILVYCIDGVSICELLLEIQRIMPLPYKAVKKYLFYLINYEILSYDGQRQVYVMEDGGYDLLDTINREKRKIMVNSEDIMITIEEGFYRQSV